MRMNREQIERDNLVRRALWANFRLGRNRMLLRYPSGEAREFITYEDYKRRFGV